MAGVVSVKTLFTYQLYVMFAPVKAGAVNSKSVGSPGADARRAVILGVGAPTAIVRLRDILPQPEEAVAVKITAPLAVPTLVATPVELLIVATAVLEDVHCRGTVAKVAKE